MKDMDQRDTERASVVSSQATAPNAAAVDRCCQCNRTEPEGGWHMVGFGGRDEPLECFCSSACLQDDLDGISTDEDDEWADAEMNCSMMADGQCGQAGSEYCDLVCPFRDD